MIKVWLTIQGPPGRQFATDKSLTPYMDSALSKSYALSGLGPIRSAIEGENVNLDVMLRNRGGRISRYFLERSPLGSRAQVFQLKKGVVTTVFDGTVYATSLGADATVSLQA